VCYGKVEDLHATLDATTRSIEYSNDRRTDNAGINVDDSML
jgi:hypothetical protein